MVNKESYTPAEVSRIIRLYVSFSDSVARLECLNQRASMSVIEVAQKYEQALRARNTLINLDFTSDLAPEFKDIDSRFHEVSQLENNFPELTRK